MSHSTQPYAQKDYEPTSHPFKVYCVMENNQLLIRACFCITKTTFVPITFILDSGLGGDLYLSTTALHTLEKHQILSYDHKQEPYINLANMFNADVHNTPNHLPGKINAIGVRAMAKLGGFTLDPVHGLRLNNHSLHYF